MTLNNSFKAIEKRFGGSSIHSPEGSELEFSGRLLLREGNSEVTIYSREEFKPSEDEFGFFDLVAVTNEGSTVHLHSCFIKSWSSWGDDHYTTIIYANYYSFHVSEYSDPLKINAIEFRLKDFNKIFAYSHFVSADLRSLTQEDKDLLTRIAPTKTASISGKDEIKDVFVKYEIDRPALSFTHRENMYSISHISWRSGFNMDRIGSRVKPSARIKFSESVTLDVALDLIRDWKIFFQQLTMEILPFTSISFSSLDNASYTHAMLYVAEDRKKVTLFRNRDVPLSSWKERFQLQACMASWLAKHDSRRQFREKVIWTAAQSREVISVDQIVSLCSAAESLSELFERSAITKQDREKLAQAAAIYATEHNIKADYERIVGLLGMLGVESLRKRLDRMLGSIEKHLMHHDSIIEGHLLRLSKDIAELRTVGAHGKSSSDLHFPRLSRVRDGFVSACIFYDLITCGVPARTGSGRLIPSHDALYFHLGQAYGKK